MPIANKPPSGGNSEIATLRQKLFIGSLGDDHHEMLAVDRIVAWAKKHHGIGDVTVDAAEPLARHIMKTKGWALRYIVRQSLQDLVLLIDDQEPEQAKSKYLPHWTDEEKAKWDAAQPRMEYKAKGLAMHIKYAAHTYKEEWDRRIGIEFPGVSIDALMSLASWAGIKYEDLDDMNAWDIYQTAMTLLEERGLGINGRNADENEPTSHDRANTEKNFFRWASPTTPQLSM